MVALAGLFLVVRASAQILVLVENHGKPAVVRAVEGRRPCVEENGKLVISSGERYAFRNVDEYLPVFVNVRELNVEDSAVRYAGDSAQLNRRFEFHAEFVSAYALDNVFLLLNLTFENGDKFIFLQEVGRLEPNKPRTIDLAAPMQERIGSGHFEFHLFSGGAEVFTSRQPSAYREAELDRMVARRIAHRPDGPPAPFTGPPPEYPAKLEKSNAAGRAVVRLRVLPNGAVDDLTVLNATDPAFGESAVASLRQWRFFPEIKAGRPVEATVELPLEFLPPKKT